VSDVREAMAAAEQVARETTGIVCTHIIPSPTEDTEKMLTISALDKD
ncbi:MAG TPA: microcompartment protein, partial [Lachnospiraceae bacterium]|nr:microcompartment protein [Lachnospiraceae bacterium]